VVLRRGVILSSNPQAGGLPLVDCLQMFTQHIRGYPLTLISMTKLLLLLFIVLLLLLNEHVTKQVLDVIDFNYPFTLSITIPRQDTSNPTLFSLTSNYHSDIRTAIKRPRTSKSFGIGLLLSSLLLLLFLLILMLLLLLLLLLLILVK
jgi:hypothetical protein